MHKGFSFFTSLPTLVCMRVCVFNNSYSDRCEVTSNCVFAFPWWFVILSIFSYFCRPCVCLWGKASSSPWLIFNHFIIYLSVYIFIYANWAVAAIIWTSWILTLYQIFSFSLLLDSCLCSAKAFLFNVQIFIYFCFCCKPSVMKLFPCVFS